MVVLQVKQEFAEGTQGNGMSVARRQVELLQKNVPRQERAKRTFEAILNAAAELLVEVGVERISTNLVAERAGVTVPALYRYFPNKYAVLHALGASLMDRQNVVFEQWFEGALEEGGIESLPDKMHDLLDATYEATIAQIGGLEIVQALRAVGPLQEVRLESHRVVAKQLSDICGQLLEMPVDEKLLNQTRMTVDCGYCLVEMVLEDETLNKDIVLSEGAGMLRTYWRSMLKLD